MSSKVLLDGSTVIEFSKTNCNNNINDSDKWIEVYNIINVTNDKDINGIYYLIGSGEYIIINDNGIYKYSFNWSKKEIIKTKDCSVLLIIPLKQSNNIYIDDYTTFIRLIE